MLYYLVNIQKFKDRSPEAISMLGYEDKDAAIAAFENTKVSNYRDMNVGKFILKIIDETMAVDPDYDMVEIVDGFIDNDAGKFYNILVQKLNDGATPSSVFSYTSLEAARSAFHMDQASALAEGSNIVYFASAIYGSNNVRAAADAFNVPLFPVVDEEIQEGE